MSVCKSTLHTGGTLTTWSANLSVNIIQNMICGLTYNGVHMVCACTAAYELSPEAVVDMFEVQPRT